MTEPKVGLKVWFTPGQHANALAHGHKLVGWIAGLNADGTVNIGYYESDGTNQKAGGVHFGENDFGTNATLNGFAEPYDA